MGMVVVVCRRSEEKTAGFIGRVNSIELQTSSRTGLRTRLDGKSSIRPNGLQTARLAPLQIELPQHNSAVMDVCVGKLIDCEVIP